jgi:hypothetical protein
MHADDPTGAGGLLLEGQACKACPSMQLGPKEFAEPVTLSSTNPADLRLAPTAGESGFDLLALRARRNSQSIVLSSRVQEAGKTISRNLRIVHFSIFPQPFVHPVDRSVDEDGA